MPGQPFDPAVCAAVTRRRSPPLSESEVQGPTDKALWASHRAIRLAAETVAGPFIYRPKHAALPRQIAVQLWCHGILARNANGLLTAPQLARVSGASGARHLACGPLRMRRVALAPGALVYNVPTDGMNEGSGLESG